MTYPHARTVIRRRPVPAGEGLSATTLHPVLRRVYAARGVSDAGDLTYALQRLPPAGQLKGMDRAVTLLAQCLTQDRRVLVLADFDADGATSCAVAVRALRAMGARDVCYVVPNRFEYGYGLSPEIVQVAASHEPDLIVTVDNGISSIDGVAAAQALGIPVLVTDHHLAGARLPDAAAIVNPNQPGCPFSAKHLAGVGVVFYVMTALRAHLRECGWFEREGLAEPNLASLLDLVALGTVADVVALDVHNRILVEQGLRRIRAGVACAGVQALIDVAGRRAAALVAADLGFAVAPRLNAAGRLTEMSLGIDCLLSDDPATAKEMAVRLDTLNNERRSIEQAMQQQAWDILDALPLESRSTLPFGLCLFDPGWHQGVIGILASRVKDRLHRPVIAFAPADNGEVKGSARSVRGLHIRDALDAIAAAQPGLLTKFGGHAMAAGLTLARADLERFGTAFDTEVRRHLGADDLQGVILSDGELAAQDLSLDLAEQLQAAGPWGHAFPEPIFDGIFEVLARRIVGGHHLKLVLRLPATSASLDAIQFNAHDPDSVRGGEQVRLAFRLAVNEYRGQRRVQLVVEHLEMV